MTLINDGSAHGKQLENYTCGRACVAIVLRIWGYNKTEKDLSRTVSADPENGCDPSELVKYFRNRKFHTNQKYNLTIKQLEKMLDKGWPVIVAYQDWAHKPSETNYHKSWDNGHYAVVVGYDDEKFWFIDPSSDRKKRSLTKEDFKGRWRDISAKEKIYHGWGLGIGPKRKLSGI